MTKTIDSLRSSYDAVAGAYVDHVYGELAQKPLDCHLLNRFASPVFSPLVSLQKNLWSVNRTMVRSIQVTAAIFWPGRYE